MTILNVTEARSKLYSLIDEAAESHQPIIIKGKRGNAVLVSEEDWNAISETLNLLSIPGMRESIREGMEPPLRSAPRTLIGEMEAGLYETSSEGCKEAGRFGSQGKSAKPARAARRQPVSESAALRKIGR
jgi:antitoxin YefM